MDSLEYFIDWLMDQENGTTVAFAKGDDEGLYVDIWTDNHGEVKMLFEKYDHSINTVTVDYLDQRLKEIKEEHNENN